MAEIGMVTSLEFPYMLNMSILRCREIRPRGPVLCFRSGDPNHPLVRRQARAFDTSFSYTHNEQIRYSNPPEASLGAGWIKSSELPALNRNAALRRQVSPH